MAEQTTTVTIAVDDTEEEVVLPADVPPFFAEEGQSPAEALGDLITMACAQQLHAMAHHSQEPPSEDLIGLEEAMGEQFEGRFGMSFADLVGHHH